MIYYITQNEATPYIHHIFEKKIDFIKPRKKELQCNKKYLQIIVYITLQFIMGQAVESVNEQLY